MSKVLIAKNITREGPGLLKEILEEHEIGYDIVDLGIGEQFPNPADYSAVFVFGGPDSANDDTLKMKQELARIKQTVELGIPYLGVCLGMQTLVKAIGGEVYRNQWREIGWRDLEGKYFAIDLTDDGRKDPIFEGVQSPLKIFHLHGETVRLTAGMQRLAGGKWCREQAVRIGTAYGFQGHLELTQEMFEEWVAQDPDLQKFNPSYLRSDYNALRQAYEGNGRRILTNFLNTARVI